MQPPHRGRAPHAAAELHTAHARLRSPYQLHLLCCALSASPRPQVITPWDVSGGADGKVDYDKIVNDVSLAGGAESWG